MQYCLFKGFNYIPLVVEQVHYIYVNIFNAKCVKLLLQNCTFFCQIATLYPNWGSKVYRTLWGLYLVFFMLIGDATSQRVEASWNF